MSYAKQFGAVGDGAADDTAAIRHCLADGDGTVVLSRGTYRITSPIEVDLGRRGPVAFAGDGGVATLLMDGPGPALRLVGSHARTADPADFEPGVWARERMPTVSQLAIVGGHGQSVGVQLEGTWQATLSGLSVRRCRYGVHLVGRNRNFLLADSHVYHGRGGGAVGVFLDRVNLHQSNIVGCHVSYYAHAGIKVLGGEVRNLQITGCDIEYNFDPDAPDSADVWVDAREGTVREGTIASCTVQAKGSPGGANVRIEGAAGDERSASAGLWAVTGNVIQSQSTNLLLRSCRAVVVSGNSFCSGFERSILLDRCRNVALGTNTVDYNPDYGGGRTDGLVVRDCGGCSVRGMVFESVRAGSAEEGGAVDVSGSSEITVSDCQVLDPAHRGVHLRRVRNAVVSGCTIVTRGRPSESFREAVLAQGCGADVLIRGNLLSRGRRGDLVAEDGAPSAADNGRAP